MPRVKTGTTRRKGHKKILKLARGYRMTRSRLFKVAHEAVLHAGEYSYRGRKERKRQMRQLWITRINAGLKSLKEAPSYSKFIHLLGNKKIILNRKSLSQLATDHPQIFQDVVKFSK
jgi:large subunit ribosomal protein L20